GCSARSASSRWSCSRGWTWRRWRRRSAPRWPPAVNKRSARPARFRSPRPRAPSCSRRCRHELRDARAPTDPFHRRGPDRASVDPLHRRRPAALRPEGGAMNAAALALLLTLSTGAAQPRFALAVSSSDGRAGRAHLWFPAEDVQRLSSALAEVGGFDGTHLRTLRDPSLQVMRGALDALAAEARASIARGEVPLILSYYPGHAAADGLELGQEILAYAELRDRLATLSGGVSGLVLD